MAVRLFIRFEKKPFGKLPEQAGIYRMGFVFIFISMMD